MTTPEQTVRSLYGHSDGWWMIVESPVGLVTPPAIPCYLPQPGGALSDSVRIGQHIRAIREGRGWSQAGVAARLGRTQAAVCRWESGRRVMGVDDLVEVAEVLGVTAAELLPDSPLPVRVELAYRGPAPTNRTNAP